MSVSTALRPIASPRKSLSSTHEIESPFFGSWQANLDSGNSSDSRSRSYSVDRDIDEKIKVHQQSINSRYFSARANTGNVWSEANASRKTSHDARNYISICWRQANSNDDGGSSSSSSSDTTLAWIDINNSHYVMNRAYLLRAFVTCLL